MVAYLAVSSCLIALQELDFSEEKTPPFVPTYMIYIHTYIHTKRSSVGMYVGPHLVLHLHDVQLLVQVALPIGQLLHVLPIALLQLLALAGHAGHALRVLLLQPGY